MKYRTDLIYPAQASPAASGTIIVPIRSQKCISRIEMTYKTTKASEGQSAPAPANIPKIELVDGATPLHSLTGYTNQALAYYSRPGAVMEHGQHINTQSEMDIYAIDFGRFLWDPQLAFDPTKFANPQLRITYNRALSDTSATVDSLEIWAEEFDDKTPSPIGFLSAREIWTSNFLAASSVNEILIPDDETIRQILVRGHYDGYEPWYQINIAKLDEASNGKVIFDYEDLEMYYRRMKSRWHKIVTPLVVTLASGAGRTYYIPQSDYWAAIEVTAYNGAGYGYTAAGSYKGGKASIYGSGNIAVFGTASGYLPWSTFQFPMGNPDDIDDWYDPSGKKPRLRLTSNTAGASGDGNVVIETVKKY